MASILRQRALSTLFGNGVTGYLGARGVGWLIDEFRAINDPEPFIKNRVAVGDTYTVVVRPRPAATERRLEADRRKQAAELDALIRPRGRARRVGLKLDAAQKREADLQGRLVPASRRSRRRAAKDTARLRRRFDALTADGATIDAAQRSLDEAQRMLDAERERAFLAARGQRRGRRPFRRRVEV